MRLWHKDLIEVLPRQQLLGQWRELNSIYKKQDKHILINFVYEYDKKILCNYSKLVIDEMFKRGYKVNIYNYERYFNGSDYLSCPYEDIFTYKMNDEYLKICYYNLLEKYRCGGISQEEWQKIEDKFGDVLND